MKKHLSLLLSILILTIILFNNLSVYAFSSYTTDPIDTSTLNDLTQITEVSEDPYSAFIDDSYYNITNDYLTTIINKLSSLPPQVILVLIILVKKYCYIEQFYLHLILFKDILLIQN